jgi:hypothetical protein
MAITIHHTAGAANANSYISLTEANELIEGLIKDEDVEAWEAGSTSDDYRNRALYTACQRIDRERFLGAKATDTQALQWPRTGVRKPDTYVNTYATGFPFRITADFFTDTEIPEQIKKAQAVLAAYLNNNKDALNLTGLEAYQTVSVGSISATPYRFGAVGFNNVPPMFERYFTGIRISGPGNISIKRS